MSLKERWKAFGWIIFDPFIIVLFILLIILYAMLYQTGSTIQTGQTSNLNSIIIQSLSLIFAIFSGILGGLLSKKWNDLTDVKVQVARGHSAIRQLKLILINTNAVYSRIHQFIENFTEIEENENFQTIEITTTHFEEISKDCLLIQEGILSSIESWTDIIPEANVKTQIGVITDLNNKVKLREVQIQELNNELLNNQDKSEADIKRIMEEKRQKEEEINRLKQDMYSTSSSSILGNPLLHTSVSGINYTPSSGFILGDRFLHSSGEEATLTSISQEGLIKIIKDE